jgi:TolB-like protein
VRHLYRLILVLVLISFCVPLADAQVDMKRVAVLDFRVTDNAVTVAEADYITNLVRGAARKALPSRNYLVITKDSIKALLPPDVNLRDCAGASCLVDVGRMVSADYVVGGEIIKFGQELRVSFMLYDSVSGNLLSSERAGAKKILDLEDPVLSKSKTLFAVLPGYGESTKPLSTPTPKSVDYVALNSEWQKLQLTSYSKDSSTLRRLLKAFAFYSTLPSNWSKKIEVARLIDTLIAEAEKQKEQDKNELSRKKVKIKWENNVALEKAAELALRLSYRDIDKSIKLEELSGVFSQLATCMFNVQPKACYVSYGVRLDKIWERIQQLNFPFPKNWEGVYFSRIIYSRYKNVPHLTYYGYDAVSEYQSILNQIRNSLELVRDNNKYRKEIVKTAVRFIKHIGMQSKVGQLLDDLLKSITKYKIVKNNQYVQNCKLVESKRKIENAWEKGYAEANVINVLKGSHLYYKGCNTRSGNKEYGQENGVFKFVHRRILNGWEIDKIEEMIRTARSELYR